MKGHLLKLGFLMGIALPAAWAGTTTYAATNRGPYKTTDGGATWTILKVTVSNGLLQGVPDVVAIAVDPVNPANVYFLGSVTGTTAVFKSTDAGQNWAAVLVPGISAGSGTQAVYGMCIDPVVTSTLYLQASNKVLRSTDSGATWTDLSSLSAITGIGGAVGIAIDPNISGVLYVTSTGGGISKSVDFGNTWTTQKLVFGFPPTLGGIFVDPMNSKRLYVARVFGQGCLDQSRAPIDCGLFLSVDAGQTWARVPIPGSMRSVAYDRATGDLYVGGNETGVGSTVLKSSDQGATWTPLLKAAGGVNNGPWVSADPAVGGAIYSVGDNIVGGLVQRTTDSGATWTKVNLPAYCAGPTSASCPSNLQGTPTLNYLAYATPAAAPAPAIISPSGIPNGPVTAESIVTATGQNLATGSANANANQPATSLAGTTVNVTDSTGATTAALVLAVSPSLVKYEIPAGVAAGAATVTIKSGDGQVTTLPIQVAAVAPGLFTVNAAGLAKAYALRLSNGVQFIEDVSEIDASGVIPHAVTVSNGDQVTLIAYGTGFRAAGGDVNVTIGGVNAQVLYAGPQGVSPGVDQINVVIPPTLAAGSVPVVLTAGGQIANTVFVSVQ